MILCTCIFFYTTMSECMICYGPTVPEINYSSSSSSSTISEKSSDWQSKNKVQLISQIKYDNAGFLPKRLIAFSHTFFLCIFAAICVS